MALIVKPDENHEPNSGTRKKQRWSASRSITKDELSGWSKWMFFQQQWEPARDVKKRRRAQRGKCGEHVQVCYSHLHHTASSLSKWEEQRLPQQACQPLMFSHHSDGHPKQQWCALLWAFWIFQDALGWHCDSSTTRKCHTVFLTNNLNNEEYEED